MIPFWACKIFPKRGHTITHSLLISHDMSWKIQIDDDYPDERWSVLLSISHTDIISAINVLLFLLIIKLQKPCRQTAVPSEECWVRAQRRHLWLGSSILCSVISFKNRHSGTSLNKAAPEANEVLFNSHLLKPSLKKGKTKTNTCKRALSR